MIKTIYLCDICAKFVSIYIQCKRTCAKNELILSIFKQCFCPKWANFLRIQEGLVLKMSWIFLNSSSIFVQNELIHSIFIRAFAQNELTFSVCKQNLCPKSAVTQYWSGNFDQNKLNSLCNIVILLLKMLKQTNCQRVVSEFKQYKKMMILQWFSLFSLCP